MYRALRAERWTGLKKYCTQSRTSIFLPPFLRAPLVVCAGQYIPVVPLLLEMLEMKESQEAPCSIPLSDLCRETYPRSAPAPCPLASFLVCAGQYIPVAPLLLEMLEMKELKKSPTVHTAQPLNLAATLKVRPSTWHPLYIESNCGKS